MMRKDNITAWEKGFPYDVLAEAGITPESSMKTIRDAAIFRFPKEPERKTAAREALRELEEIPKRLVVDFFLYQGPVQAQEDQHER
jgi:hypothetical protein